jgi:hypothetical protein
VEIIEGDEWVDPASRTELTKRLRDFAAHFAVGIPNAGYGLFYRGNAPETENLFSDALSIPLVLPWDHLLTQAPVYLIGDYGYEYSPKPGLLRGLRERLNHPFLRHYVPDSAHIEIYESLGLLAPNSAKHYQPAALPHFIEFGRRGPSEPQIRDRIGFAGNIYAPPAAFSEVPLLKELTEAIIAGKLRLWDVSGWHILSYLLEQIPEETRYRLGLLPDFHFFWHFAKHVLELRVGTAFRLDVFNSIDQEIDFYGNFASREALDLIRDSERIRYRGVADFVTELPAVYASYPLWVDVTNAPFIRGCGAKVFHCFAAGSMMLIDFREDLKRQLGDLADSFMYRNAEDLREKIALYLNEPMKRREVIEAVQGIIRDRVSWQQFCRQICSENA